MFIIFSTFYLFKETIFKCNIYILFIILFCVIIFHLSYICFLLLPQLVRLYQYIWIFIILFTILYLIEKKILLFSYFILFVNLLCIFFLYYWIFLLNYHFFYFIIYNIFCFALNWIINFFFIYILSPHSHTYVHILRS